jgi:hypothetical protein
MRTDKREFIFRGTIDIEPPRVRWRLCPKWRMERWPDLRGTLVRCVSVR